MNASALERRDSENARPGAFTLIEIMIVVAILGIVLAMGLPSMIRSLREEPMREAVTAVTEGLAQARAQAILRGNPWQLVLRPSEDTGESDYGVSVEPLMAPVLTGADASGLGVASVDASTRPLSRPFAGRIGGGVMITLLEVNFSDQMGQDQARVRFFPNGTSDDFTVILEADRQMRRIWLDPVTALADLEVIR